MTKINNKFHGNFGITPHIRLDRKIWVVFRKETGKILGVFNSFKEAKRHYDFCETKR